MKKKYDVAFIYHATAYVTVEAESEQEALDLAEGMPAASAWLCHQCCKTLELGEIYDAEVTPCE